MSSYSYRAAWMSDGQWRAAQCLADCYGGFNHLPDIKQFGNKGIRVNVYGGISTFDFLTLTRLVMLAHDRCVRIEISQGGPGRIGIIAHARNLREGDTFERHPTLAEAVEMHRKSFPAETQWGGV